MSDHVDVPDGSAGLVNSLAALSRVLVGITARTLADMAVEITISQHRALVILAAHGPLRSGDLAAALQVHPSTVSRTCDRLARRDFVTRYHRGPDRRVSWVGLTERGRDLVGEVIRRRTAEISRLVAAITTGPDRPAVEVLDALVAAAGEPTERQWWLRWAESVAA